MRIAMHTSQKIRHLLLLATLGHHPVETVYFDQLLKYDRAMDTRHGFGLLLVAAMLVSYALRLRGCLNRRDSAERLGVGFGWVGVPCWIAPQAR